MGDGRIYSPASVHRPVRRADEIAVDYARDFDPGAWRGRLTGIDAVINTVGIREGRGRRFDAIHDQASVGPGEWHY